MEGMAMAERASPRPSIPVMTALSFLALAAGLVVPPVFLLGLTSDV
jgi:hypothetical protein